MWWLSSWWPSYSRTHSSWNRLIVIYTCTYSIHHVHIHSSSPTEQRTIPICSVSLGVGTGVVPKARCRSLSSLEVRGRGKLTLHANPAIRCEMTWNCTQIQPKFNKSRQMAYHLDLPNKIGWSVDGFSIGWCAFFQTPAGLFVAIVSGSALASQRRLMVLHPLAIHRP